MLHCSSSRMQRPSLLPAAWQLGHRWQVTKAKFPPALTKAPTWEHAEDGNKCGLYGTESCWEMNPGNWDNLASPLPLLMQLSLPLASRTTGESLLLLPCWAPHSALQSTNELTHHLRGGPHNLNTLGDPGAERVTESFHGRKLLPSVNAYFSGLLTSYC